MMHQARVGRAAEPFALRWRPCLALSNLDVMSGRRSLRTSVLLLLASLTSLAAASCGSDAGDGFGPGSSGGPNGGGERSLAQLERIADLYYVVNLASDGTNLYMASTPPGPVPTLSAVTLADIGAATPPPLRPLTQMPEFTSADAFGIETDGAFVYYTADSSHWRVSVAGGTPERLTPVNVSFYRLRLHGEHLYFASETRIQRMPKAGGPVETVYGDLKRVRTTLGIHGDTLYFMMDKSFYRAPIYPPGEIQMLTTLEDGPSYFAVNGRFVYVAEREEGDTPPMFGRFPVTGGPLEVLSTDFDPTSLLAVEDGAYVSHNDHADGDVMYVGNDEKTPSRFSDRHGVRTPILVGPHLYWASESSRVERIVR